MNLLTHPLFLVGATVAVFLLNSYVYRLSGQQSLLHPVLPTVLMLIVGIHVLGIPYRTYWEGTTILHIFLGPAIVALAVPLYDSLKNIGAMVRPLAISLIVCAVLIMAIGYGLGSIAQLGQPEKLTLLTRSVTAPIAIEIAPRIGSEASLAVLSVIVTGVIGITIMPGLLRLLSVEDERARGFTLGLIAHAFGVARALEISKSAAALATIAMVFAGCFAAIVLPLLMGR